MSVSDPIGDFLTCIRNGLRARHSSISVPTSKIKEQLAEILKREGFVSDYKVNPGKSFGKLEVSLRYRSSGEPMIEKIERVSRPGCRRYASVEDLSQMESGIVTTIMTTSKGLMTSTDAKKAKMGGELICQLV